MPLHTIRQVIQNVDDNAWDQVDILFRDLVETVVVLNQLLTDNMKLLEGLKLKAKPGALYA